nr:insulinase family protein [Sphingomonas daechungensis]
MNSFNVSAATVALAVALSPVTASAHSAASQTVSVRPLIEKAPLQYERFTLVNGLRVLVHTDRKAPVVALSVYYDVGSKHEPKGKTGFAHLFEHLMFNGSENADGDWFEPMAQIGATALNGSTWFDRTNYFETVPVGPLNGRSTWSPTGWATCWAPLLQTSSAIRSESFKTRKGRVTTSRLGWSATSRRSCCSRPAIPTGTRRSARWPI